MILDEAPPHFALRMRALGVYTDKHIPGSYLRGSIEQRLALVQGLMDTDGHVNADGYCTFSNTNLRIVEGLEETLRSLGITPRRVWRSDPRSLGGGCYKVHFMPYLHNPFRLPRKANRVRMQSRTRQASWRAVTSIEKVSSQSVRCIRVSAADHLFVFGRGWAVTHNCHRFRHSAAGRAFFDELARNITRKWNTRVLAGTQRPLDMIDLDVQGLTSETFIGRIEDRAIAADALNLAGIPTGVGYEPIIGTLSPSDTTRQVRTGFREFVFRDVDRNVERVRIDLDHLPGFVEALNTTPGSVGCWGLT